LSRRVYPSQATVSSQVGDAAKKEERKENKKKKRTYTLRPEVLVSLFDFR